MRIDRISLQHFRSYSAEDIDLRGVNAILFLGENGAGKTNILEALSILSLSKSCQRAEEHEVIRWGEGYYRIRCTAMNDAEEEKMLEVVSQVAPRKQKACFINDVRVPVTQMVGTLPIVLFLPQDLDLFSGAPAARRQFLDQLLCQVSPKYMQTLSHYQKVLKQRNSVLKNIVKQGRTSDDLAVWNGQLAELGADITLERLALLHVLGCTLQQELESLGETWEKVELVYERKTTKREKDTLVAELTELLAHYQERDLILQTTSVGPHREDWVLECDGRAIQSFGSRGQQRTALLALLFLEVSYLELQRGEKPVVLLDDVFSELDDNHQKRLLSALSQHQVFFTATHVPSGLENTTVFDVKEGRVIEREALVV